MDRFDAMRAFIRIVERRSFTQAAGDLGLPRSTVTEAVQQLEARLGVRLLQRTTRQVTPTLDGEAYYRRCLTIIAEVEDAEAAFAGTTPGGGLRVDVHGTLARHFLLPRLPEFLAAYPQIALRLSEGDRLVDLVREGVDCVVRVGEPRDSDMIGRRVALLTEVTCATPGYLDHHGRPDSVEHLAATADRHRMIGFLSSATGEVMPLEFTVAGRRRLITLPLALCVTGAESLTAAARLGLGLIQVPRYHVAAELRAGSLEAVLPDQPPDPTPVTLLYPRNRQLSPRLRVFIDWTARCFATAATDR